MNSNVQYYWKHKYGRLECLSLVKKLGMMWKYVDESRRLKTVPICTLNTNTASKIEEQVRFILEEVLKNNSVIGFSKISIQTITTCNEASVLHAEDLLTDFFGEV